MIQTVLRDASRKAVLVTPLNVRRGLHIPHFVTIEDDAYTDLEPFYDGNRHDVHKRLCSDHRHGPNPRLISNLLGELNAAVLELGGLRCAPDSEAALTVAKVRKRLVECGGLAKAIAPGAVVPMVVVAPVRK